MSKKEDKSSEEEIVFDNGGRSISGFGKKADSKLKKELKQIKAEKKEYLDGWQRARAELANLKKQHAEEKKLFTSLGREALLLDIFPILDNFEAAFANQKAWEKVDAEWRTGIEHIYKQFIQTLEESGIEQVGEVGEKFDENLHTASGNIPTEEKKEDHTVAEVLKPGYKLGEKIIREAQVKVFELKD